PLNHRAEDDLPVPVVSSDWQAMGECATGALLDRGHRRIAFVSGELKPGMWHARCLSGYVTAHVHAQLAVDPQLVFNVPEAQSAGPAAAQGVLAMTERPTAYVCINVGTASRFVSAMNKAGQHAGPDNVVICGMPYLLRELDMERFPVVTMDPDKIMDAAITQLRAKCAHLSALNTTTLVPFNTHNLSTIRHLEA
ncbi:MAG: substrate-binding domain-containing protein, partial [Phycisphaeraceae bacterium]